MTRRTLLQLGGAAVATAAPVSRPNILFLMTDQHRADCLGVSGNQVIHTPNIDRIAHEGVRFSAAYSSTPTCTPARTAILTGLSPWRHGMLGYSDMAARYPVEKPQAMRDAGYTTTTIGKNHYTPMRNGPAALAEAEKAGPIERSDYEQWFYREAPGLDPHATGIWWNDYRARPFAMPERLHPTT